AERDVSAPVAARCLGYLGQVYILMNDGEKALEPLESALRRLQEVEHPWPPEVATYLAMIGHAQYLQGHDDLAEQYYERSMAELTRAGRDHEWLAAKILDHWAIVACNSGNPLRGVELYDRVQSIYMQNGVDALTSRPSVAFNP